MAEFTLTEIAHITEGKLLLPAGFTPQRITRIATDSRTLTGDEPTLFFALRGPQKDGHHFIEQLMARENVAFVISDTGYINPEAPFILVDHTTMALQKLAAYHRHRFKYPVLGITGSNGKTIVKEWLHDLLSGEQKTIRSPKSYNSQVGVPLSVLLMEPHYDLGVFEAGISKPGEMKNLLPVIDPDIGILTNIGDAHQENFESKKHKLREKLHLFSRAGELVYCEDDQNISGEIHAFCTRHSIKKINWTLQNKKALIRFRKEMREGATTLSVATPNQSFSFTIPFTDESSIENACHCFAAAYVITGNPEKIIHRFTGLTPVAMRLEIIKGINNSLLINDFYNSDLTSLSIALSVLHQQAKKGHMNKQVILSDIRQTGIPQAELYSQVNKLLNQWKIDEITGIGPVISAHSGVFTMQKSFYPSTGEFEKQFARSRFSHSAILMKGARAFTFEKISDLLQEKTHQTVLEINLNALVNNLNAYRKLLHPGTKIMVMVKAFSYGSGDVEVAQMLQFQNADYLAVAVSDEGVELRQAGIRVPIVVMNPEEHSFQQLIDFGLEPNIYGLDILQRFKKAVAKNGLQHFPIHLKIDTGMNRLGFKTDEEVNHVISELAAGDLLKVKSVFTHLAASDDPDSNDFTEHQIERFDALAKKLTRAFPGKMDRHVLNSAGIERFPGKQYEMVRLGIGLYGVSATGLPLENISTFKSTISQVKKVMPGETVGYGRRGKIDRESEIAVVPVGYADGLDRKLGNGNGQAWVKGKRVPLVGDICMDMLMLDVTGLNVTPGDTVEFFGPHISVAEVAEKAGTIPYEILTGISQRVKRIYLHE